MTGALVVTAKLALVAASVLFASLVARRFGPAAGGLLAGLPMIAGPIVGLLLIDLPADLVSAVCLATLSCQPALMAYLVAYAHAAQRLPWWACLALALAVFFMAGAALLALGLGPLPAALLAMLSPLAGAASMPAAARRLQAAAQSLPRVELAARVGVALAVAAGVMWGARHLSPGPAGLLLAAPITGIVLPSFMLPRHGPVATAALLGGFVRGQAGFVTFFVVALLLLPRLHPAAAWLLSMAAAAVLPWAWGRLRRR